MRLKATDPGAWGYKVFLDGQELKHCYEADDETGEAWCYKTDEGGHCIKNAARDDVEREKRTGKVEFKQVT